MKVVQWILGRAETIWTEDDEFECFDGKVIVKFSASLYKIARRKMPKKVLVYFDLKELKPIGGPSGYLYNMKIGLDSLGIESVKFINSVSYENESRSISRRIWGQLPRIIKKIAGPMILIATVIRTSDNLKCDLAEYDVIHFHDTLSLYLNKKMISAYKGKILLSCHSPKPWHKEVYEDNFNSVERIIYMPFYKLFEKVDSDAFMQADYIIFPCKEAEEPYQNNWNKYSNIVQIKKENYRYIPTGIEPSKATLNRDQVVSKYNIPNNSFIISYVGRHNRTKGFDLLKEIGIDLLNKYDNVVFLIAGTEEPLKGLKHDRWIEVGWTKDPHSIISASDIFILPNKETYFDLIMLEVLSLGKIVIAKESGGNKLFRKFPNHAIKYFNTKEEAISQIEYCLRLSKEAIKIEGIKNQELFKNEFTLDIFINKYIQMIDGL